MAIHEVSSHDLETLKNLGWHLDGNRLVGKYQTAHGSWDGIIKPGNDGWEFYILDCPRQVLIGGHRNCFRSRSNFEGRSVHFVHFHTSCIEPIGGIAAVTKVIEEDVAESPANDVGH